MPAPLAARPPLNSLPNITRAVPSAQVPIQTKTGLRYQTLLKDVGSKTALRREIIVRLTHQQTFKRDAKVTKTETGKKIKRRLEDLERRASSPDGSPEQVHLDLASARRVTSRTESAARREKTKSNKKYRPNRQMTLNHAAPHHERNMDAHSALFPLQPMRDTSLSPPPQLSYSYSLPEPVTSTPYTPNASYQPVPSSYPDYQGLSYYLPPLPTTLPSMPAYDFDSGKPEFRFEEDGMFDHFNNHFPYPSFDGLEIPQPYQDSNTHVNDLFRYP
ncbi:MAG: hypothetical protein Q9211_001451 [Gyalolechia sp. 1 TL-2023]